MMKKYGLIFSGIMLLALTLSSPLPLFAGEGHRHEQMEHGMETKTPAAEHVVIDPVCGMNVKPEEAAGHAKYKGTTYYFCMASEVETFKKDPEKYLAQVEGLQPSSTETPGQHPGLGQLLGNKAGVSAGPDHPHGMSHSGHWMAPEGEGKKKNPVPATTAGADRGREIFTTHCAVCHGSGGKGDGFLAATLDPKPADLTGALSRGQTDGDLFWKISTGRGTMPGWAEAFSKEDRWHLIHYIRSLQK